MWSGRGHLIAIWSRWLEAGEDPRVAGLKVRTWAEQIAFGDVVERLHDKLVQRGKAGLLILVQLCTAVSFIVLGPRFLIGRCSRRRWEGGCL